MAGTTKPSALLLLETQQEMKVIIVAVEVIVIGQISFFC